MKQELRLKLFLVFEETDLLSFIIKSSKTHLVTLLKDFFSARLQIWLIQQERWHQMGAYKGICLLSLESRQAQHKVYSK